jgi:hypothetical protein
MHWGDIGPSWYAGLLRMDYDMAFDSFMGEGEDEEPRFKEAFNALAARRGEDGVAVVYTHPTRLVTSQFWDVPYCAGANPRTVGPAPLRASGHIQKLKDRFRRLLDWTIARPGVRLTDMSGAYAQRTAKRRDLSQLLDECGLKPGDEGSLPLREPPDPDAPFARKLDSFRYNWPIYPKGFTGERLRALMRQLAWTAAPG